MPLSVVPAAEVSGLVPFYPELVNSAAQGNLETTVKGRIKQCGKEAILSCGSLLRGYDTQTGQPYMELQVGRQERPLVGPFVELVRGRSAYLGVAVSGGSGGPLLCVCQPVSGRVVRAIRLAAPVTHMCVVSAQRLGVLSGGCVALATEDRCLLLLDLCLDSAHHYSDELRPANLVRLESISSDQLPNISAVHGAPMHCFVPLCDLGDLAELDEMAVSNGDMEVTCLQWLPQLFCLGIGLSCGTVHLWDVHKSSSVLVITLQSDLPVVSLALQEPENDPRCCCYLWSAQASTGNSLSSFAVTSMHALTFGKKELGEDGHPRYKGLVSGRPMFEYSLVPDVVPGMEGTAGQSPQDEELLGSRILSFRTMWSLNTSPTSDGPLSPASPARSGLEHVEDLLLISWQLVRGSRVLGTYLSVFDINQWYRAQMPRTFRSNAFQLCSFIGLFSLEEPVARSGNHAVLDVRVLQSSIKRFYSQNPMVEQTHFPSSLEFTCVLLTTEGTVQASFLGLQRQVLNYMNMEGPACLGNASDLYVHFSIVGLISDSLRSGGAHLSQAVAQKTALNVALENRLVGFLAACVRARLSGEPLLPFMLEWTWAKVKDIKRSLDILYMPLFDCSGQDVTLIGCRMSTHLEELRILHRLLEQALGMPADNRDVLCVWNEVTGLLAGHLSVLLFLVQAGLLPDHRMGDGLAYPYGILNTWCHQARNDMGGRLLVDVLAEEALQNLDNDDSGHPLATSYPPLNLQRATELYLQRDLETWEPHAITYYLLLDISAVISLEYPQVKEELEVFPTVFHLGDDLQSLIQGIWYLDHGKYKEGTEMLLHAMSVVTVSMRPLLSALWTPVVRLLLRCGQAPLALLYLDHMQPLSTQEQMSLCLDILLANCRVVDALELVRRHSHLSSLEQLLGCIFAVSRKAPEREAHALFEELLRVPLSVAEEDQLINFFCELADPMWLCHVILHFLECKRPQAALLPTASLRELFREGKAQRSYRPDVRQRAFATLEVMQSALRLMPVPASQRNAAARARSQSGQPVQHLGTVPTRVPHKGTTPRLVTQVAKVRATMDPAEASQPPKLPMPPTRGMAKDSHAQTPAASGHRSSLGRGLDAEALSMLCTPPVMLWQGPTQATPSAVQPSTSTPASILKRRAQDLPPVTTTLAAGSSAAEGDPGTCPTPLALDEDVCPTPDPTVRRLRFAVSESFSSDNTPDPEATAESMEEEASFVSQSEEPVSIEEQASSPMVEASSFQVEADVSSDRSYRTAADSGEEECGTDLQDSPSEPVPASSTPRQHLPASESVGTDLQVDGGKAEVLGASPPSPGQKGLLPAFLIRETARRLQGPSALDTTFAESPGLSGEAAPRQPSGGSPTTAAVPSSPAKSDKTPDEDDLDGTPLADEDEGTELRGEDVPQLSSVTTEPSEGPAALPEERAASQMPGGFSNEPPMVAEPVEGTPLQGDDGTELADDVSQPCSEESSMTLPPMPAPSVTESHTTSTKVRVVEEVSSESIVSQPYSEESAMSLRLPAFATSKGHTVAGEATAAEEVIVISASEGSEASEVEQEDDDEIFIVSDASSDALPEVLPTRVESPEDSWSRSCGATTVEEGDVVLTELTSMPSAQLNEPLEMPREPSVGLLAAALDVEEVHVERSLPGYAVCPSEEEGSLPKPEDHLQAPDTPATPAQPESRAVGESYGFVPAVDSPPVVGSGRGGGATLPEEEASSPGTITSSFSVVTPLKQPPAPTAVASDAESDEEGDAELSEEPLSPGASSEHSSSIGGQHETGHDSSAEKTLRTPKHKAVLDKSAEKVVVTSSYNLRETRKSTWKEEENKANQSRSRRKSGPVSPSKPTPPAIATRAGPSRDSDTSPKIAVTPKRKTRAASEEPSTPHSRIKAKALAGSLGRRKEKASSVSPKSITQSSKAKAQTPSAKGKSTGKVATSAAAAGESSKRLATPRPSRSSAVPSSKKAGPSHDVERGKSPSPTRESSTSPARTPTRRSTRKSATPSPTKQKAVQRATQKSVAGSPKSKKSAVSSSQEKTSEASAPLKISLRTRSHADASTPGRTEKTPEKMVPSTRASGTRQKRSATLSPPGRTARTPSPAQKSPVHSPEKTKTPSPEKAGAPKKRLRHHSSSSAVAERESSPVPGPSKRETPSKRASSRVPRTPKHSSSADVVDAPLPVSTRRSSRLTPDKQPAAREHEAEKPKLPGTRRRVLETIAEVDTSPTKSDTETSPTAPSTRKGRRSLSAEPDQSAPPKRLLLATRRSRRVSGNIALDTIAEAPEAEKEREPQPGASRQQGSRPKRKADTELDAEGFKLSRPMELAHKGSKSTPPKGEFVFSPPVTRYRQHKSQPSGKPAEEESAPSSSKEQAPKKKRRQRLKIVTTLMKTPRMRGRVSAVGSSSSSSTPLRTPRRTPARYKRKPRTPEIPLPASNRQADAAASSSTAKSAEKSTKKRAK